MNTIFIYISMILSYYLSYLVDYKTKKTILNYLASYNYTIKDGNQDILKSYVNIYSAFRILYYVPLINIISSLIESIINLRDIDGILEELKEDEYLSNLTYNEINDYNDSLAEEEVALDIFYDREEISCKKNEIIDIDSNKKYELVLNKIIDSDIDNFNKKVLLDILRYNIVNNIDNIDYTKLINYMSLYVDGHYSGYYKLFKMNIPKNSFELDSFNNIIMEANKVINTNLDNIDKDKILTYIEKNIIDEIRINGRGKHNNVDVNINIDSDNNRNSTISIRSRKKQKNINSKFN